MHAFTKLSSNFNKPIQTVHHTRKVIKGTYLFQEETVGNELFVILSGKLQISKMVPDGREITIRMCQKGDLIGELSLFTRNGPYSVNAKVLEDGEVAVIYKSDLEKELEENNAFALEFMKWLLQQQRKANTKFRDLVLQGKKGALCSILIRLANSYGVKTEKSIVIDAALTNQEIANFCGTSREVINRLLSDLRKRGIISTEKGTITILDLDYLRDEIDCENCPIDICNVE